MNESPVSLGDRLKAAIVAIVRELDPYREYAGFHEYRVLAGTSLTGWALQAVESNMPDLMGVNFFAGGGAATVFAPGSTVLVGFVNRDPGRPFIAFDGTLVRHGEALAAVTIGAYIVQKVPPP